MRTPRISGKKTTETLMTTEITEPESEVEFLKWGRKTTDYTDFTDFLVWIFHHLQLRRSCRWNLFQSVKSV